MEALQGHASPQLLPHASYVVPNVSHNANDPPKYSFCSMTALILELPTRPQRGPTPPFLLYNCAHCIPVVINQASRGSHSSATLSTL